MCNETAWLLESSAVTNLFWDPALARCAEYPLLVHLAYQCSFLFVCFIGLYAEHPYMVGVHPFELFFFYWLLVACTLSLHAMYCIIICIKMLVFVGIGVIILGGVFFLCVLGNCGRKFIKFVYGQGRTLCVSL